MGSKPIRSNATIFSLTTSFLRGFFFFAEMMSCAGIMMSSIVPSLSILNVYSHLQPPALSDERLKQGLPSGCITLLCALQCRTHALAIHALVTSNSLEFYEKKHNFDEWCSQFVMASCQDGHQ